MLLRVDSSSRDDRAAGTAAAKGSLLQSVTITLIVDIGAPLAAYSVLRSAGLTAVTALLVSGVFPALSVAVGAIRHGRLEVVGALVLAGILVGTVLGLVSHSARLLLVEGSVPTAVFSVACLGSLWARRPLMFSFAREFTGPDTAKGQEMTRLSQFEGYRRVWQVITAWWGAGLLLEAGLRVVIIYSAAAGTALAISKVMPFLFMGTLSAWTVAYGTYRKRKGERLATAASPVEAATQVQP
jgi:hypothetical protein